MWKLILVLSGFIIFAVLFTLGNASSAASSLVQILFTGLAAIFIMIVAISIAPWLNDKGY